MEKEYDWYYSLIEKHFYNYPDDYRTILEHAKVLLHTHENELKELIVKSFRAYAASRFTPKKRVKSSRYTYFREALSGLADLGLTGVQRELVTFFIEEYKSRLALRRELTAIKLYDD